MSLRAVVMRWWVRSLLGLLVIYFVGVALLAATWGRAHLQAELTKLTGRQVVLERLRFNPFTNRLTLGGFSLAEGDAEIMGFDSLSVDVELLPLLSHTLRLREVSLVSPRVQVVLLADGQSTNLQRLVQTETTQTAPTTTPESARPFDLDVVSVAIRNGQVTFEDDSRQAKPVLKITHINFQADNVKLVLDGSASQPAAFQLALTLAESGRVNVSGQLTPTPLALTADLQLDALPLTLANGWLADVIKGQIVSGKLHGKLNLKVANDAVQMTGGVKLDQFDLRTPEDVSVLAFDTLELDQLALDTASHMASLNAVNVTGVTGKLVAFADGTTSVDRLLVTTPPVDKRTVVAQSPTGAGQAGDDAGANWHLLLKQFTLDAKELVFEDHAVKPVYRIQAAKLKLTTGPFDNHSGEAASVDMETHLDGYAPLSIKGKAALFAKQPGVNLRVAMNGYEMTQLTPYTGRYIGYKVQKGQLEVTSQVALKGTYLESKNSVGANSFQLGDKVKSADAINAPVKLGLAILRDGKGNISLPLNVAGDLSDPGVSVPGLIMKAILNVLTKAATAPLSALSALAGGINLEQVAFAAGSKEVEQEGLKGLADVLAQRPALMLGLSGSAGEPDARLFAERGLQGEALTDAMKALADARAHALKIMLVDHYDVKPERLFLEQPQTQRNVVGVLLTATNQ